MISLNACAVMRVRFRKAMVLLCLRNVMFVMLVRGLVLELLLAWHAVRALGHPLLEALYLLRVWFVMLGLGALLLLPLYRSNAYLAMPGLGLRFLAQLLILNVKLVNRALGLGQLLPLATFAMPELGRRHLGLLFLLSVVRLMPAPGPPLSQLLPSLRLFSARREPFPLHLAHPPKLNAFRVMQGFGQFLGLRLVVHVMLELGLRPVEHPCHRSVSTVTPELGHP